MIARRPPREAPPPPGAPAHAAALVTLGLMMLAAPALRGATSVGDGAARRFDEAVAAHQAGESAQALIAYREVAAAVEASDPALAAAALTNSCLLLADLGRSAEAKPLCERALAASERSGGESRLEATLNLARVQDETGDRAAARVTLALALSQARRVGDAVAEVMALSNGASLESGAGRYGAALQRLAEAETRLDQVVGEGTSAAWVLEQREITRINRGVVLERLGAHREALALYGELLASSIVDRGRRAALLVNTGVLERNLGDPPGAMRRFRAAIADFEALGDRAGLANAWLNVGLALELDLARPAEAEDAYREALAQARVSGESDQEVQAGWALGRLRLAAGRLAEARTDLEAALSLARRSEFFEGVWAAEEALGRLAARSGDAEGAARHFHSAMAAIETARSELAAPGRRAGFFGDKRAVYVAAMDLAVAAVPVGLGDEKGARRRALEKAFELVQRTKARDLVDALGGAGLGASGLEGFSVAALGAELGPADRFVEFAFGEERLYRFVLEGGSLRVEDRAAAAEIRRLVAAVNDPEARRRPVLGAEGMVLARHLFEDLNAPGDGGRLRIAPQGVLFSAPLERLLEASWPEGGVEILIEPSAAAWWALRRRRASAPERADAPLWVAFGPPGAGPAFASGLRELPGAAAEARSIGAWLDPRHRGQGRTFLGDEASEEAFRQAPWREARLLHVATHATVPTEFDAGGIALGRRMEDGATGDGASPEDRDGWVTPQEIAAVERPADLVVLSACSSGGGFDDAKGRALASLAGAFLAAGSAGVVVSRWDVEDEATRVWMEQFYAALARGMTPARALAATRDRLRRDPRWNRPEVWAAWAVVGEPPALITAERWPRAGWLVALLVAAAAGWALARRVGGARRARCAHTAVSG